MNLGLIYQEKKLFEIVTSLILCYIRDMETNMKTINGSKTKWVNIPSPSTTDIELLEKEYNFHHLDLEDCLTENQRAKIDRYDDYTFLILHLPTLHSRTNRIVYEELNIFISDSFLICLHDEHDFLNKLFNQALHNDIVAKDFMGSGSGYLLYKILNETFESMFKIVDDLTRETNKIEREVFQTDNNRDMLKDILLLKKDIINFRRIILPQRTIIAQLEHMTFSKNDDDLEVYFDNVVDKIEKIYSSLENLNELVERLHQTNESIIFHNTNNVIKVLTVFSVVMLPLTFVTGFYGMNVALPLQNSNNSVLWIVGIMLTILGSMLGYFKYKDWI